MSQETKMSALNCWPPSERPRERLFQQGVEALSDADLIALFLRSGKRGKNVRSLSLELLSASEGLIGLAKRSPQELLKIAGLGPAKVSCLVACFEIARRIAQEKLILGPRLNSARKLFKHLHSFFVREREEVFMAALLNSKNQLLKLLPLSRGDSTQILVSLPQILRQLILQGPAAVIFLHNHPSGDPAPSEEDKIFTERLWQACQAIDLPLHDHIILGHQRYFSFAEEGLLSA